MTDAPTQTSRDWLGSVHTSLLAWWMPKAAILAGLFVPVSFRAVIWIIALIWMGTACILNVRRCNRTHCRYTGPYYLAMIMPVIALGAGLVTVGILGWVCLGVIILGGKRAYMVGYRAGMGKVLVAHDNYLEWLHLRFRMSRSLDVWFGGQTRTFADIRINLLYPPRADIP
jgi:hypothetical protein